MNKAIIAIDSFKGCLTSEEAGSAVMEGIKTIFPDCETLLFPIADGGEGMLDSPPQQKGNTGPCRHTVL